MFVVLSVYFLSQISVIPITSNLMLISLRRVWSWSELYEREDMFILKKLVPLWLLDLNAFLKSATSKYSEEFSKSDSLTASLSLSIRTFSMDLLFLVKVLNLIVLAWIVEWKSLSFSAGKGYNIFEQVNHYHTVLSLSNKFYVCTLILSLDVNP